MDVFVKIITHFSPNQNNSSKGEDNELLGDLENMSVYLNVAEVQLFFILNDYFTVSEINGLIAEIRAIKK